MTRSLARSMARSSGNGTDRDPRGASLESASQVEDRRAAIPYPKVLAGALGVAGSPLVPESRRVT
jgi:hypothetical protein